MRGGASPTWTIRGRPNSRANSRAHLQWPDAPIPHDDAAAANLDPTNYIAIAGNHAACSLYIDSTGPEELRDSIGGNKTDRTDVEKGLYRLALPVDHIFAKAVESRLAGRSGIRHGGDAARKASLIGPDREIATSIPDVNVKVGPARRNIRARAINAQRAGIRHSDDPPAAVDMDVYSRRQGIEADRPRIAQRIAAHSVQLSDGKIWVHWDCGRSQIA
jgi:hypothetical protein